MSDIPKSWDDPDADPLADVRDALRMMEKASERPDCSTCGGRGVILDDVGPWVCDDCNGTGKTIS